LNLAIRQAVFPGGKRWRPALTLLGGGVTGARACDLLPPACAVEYVHTASLILDDLPAMDDAPIRRGRDALHRCFGDDLALLAALALLNRSYELFLLPLPGVLASRGALRLAAAAARAIGIDGMVGGQAADLSVATSRGALSTRQRKTTTLVRLAVTAGALAAGADDDDVSALGRYGECLGGAYQIYDDLMDESGDAAVTGKTVGQDMRHARQTWPVLLRTADARTQAAALVLRAQTAVTSRFGDRRDARLLVAFAELIVNTVGGAESASDARLAV